MGIQRYFRMRGDFPHFTVCKTVEFSLNFKKLIDAKIQIEDKRNFSEFLIWCQPLRAYF